MTFYVMTIMDELVTKLFGINKWPPKRTILKKNGKLER